MEIKGFELLELIDEWKTATMRVAIWRAKATGYEIIAFTVRKNGGRTLVAILLMASERKIDTVVDFDAKNCSLEFVRDFWFVVEDILGQRIGARPTDPMTQGLAGMIEAERKRRRGN